MAPLHRAGADSVLSYGSMGASAVMNFLQRGNILMVAEGLYLFEIGVPAELAGRTIAESSIRQRTDCTVVALRTERGVQVVPDAFAKLPAGADIVLIGTAEAEERFLETYGGSGAAGGRGAQIL